MKKTTLKQLRKGEFFCLNEFDDSQTEVPSSKVWVRGEYDRSERKYEIFRFNDVNHTRFIKGTKQVFTDIYF